MSYDVNDLREDLKLTIQALRSGDPSMTVEKAKAISELGQTIINSAKVEVDMLRAVGTRVMTPTGFVPLASQGDTLDKQDGAQRQQLEGPKPRPHIREAVGASPRGSLR